MRNTDKSLITSGMVLLLRKTAKSTSASIVYHEVERSQHHMIREVQEAKQQMWEYHTQASRMKENIIKRNM